MTVSDKTYKVGDLFTTQKSKVTGVIKAIEPKNDNTTLVLLDVDGEERFTTVTI
jgi:predicted lipoprotein